MSVSSRGSQVACKTPRARVSRRRCASTARGPQTASRRSPLVLLRGYHPASPFFCCISNKWENLPSRAASSRTRRSARFPQPHRLQGRRSGLGLQSLARTRWAARFLRMERCRQGSGARSSRYGVLRARRRASATSAPRRARIASPELRRPRTYGPLPFLTSIIGSEPMFHVKHRFEKRASDFAGVDGCCRVPTAALSPAVSAADALPRSSPEVCRRPHPASSIAAAVSQGDLARERRRCIPRRQASAFGFVATAPRLVRLPRPDRRKERSAPQRRRRD